MGGTPGDKTGALQVSVTACCGVPPHDFTIKTISIAVMKYRAIYCAVAAKPVGAGGTTRFGIVPETSFDIGDTPTEFTAATS